jgi:hypothetical protein
LIIVSSPIWVPAGTFFFLLAAGFLSMCGFGVVAVAASSWLYRYFRGLHPPGSDRVDYARSRIYDTASHVKDYAREYGGYLQSKVKDAAPGAWTKSVRFGFFSSVVYSIINVEPGWIGFFC